MTFFLAPITSGCRGVLEWSKILSENAFSSDTRPYRRTQAIGLLTALLRSPTSGEESNKPKVENFVDGLIGQLKTEIGRCASEPGDVKPKYNFSFCCLAERFIVEWQLDER
jgi:hypothetical protein